MKRARRIISHHGSDCPDGPHPFKRSRCLILTRIDRPGQLSVAWISGDCAETMPMRAKAPGSTSERLYRKRHTFAADLPTYYGGGFWERVCLPPRCCPHGAAPGPCYLCTPAAACG